ncbi:unnamed protein product [Linum tenue]|uniref:non-specific serine/threonine protein kinase n=1 Tax=Linum tenue TaxID=586396 RepID=A0AAV0NKI5_9ROSI|nr:unnamed protein product [Linum tenue]
MKLHRLGRTSFRVVKSKHDYLRHLSSFSWLYLSRLAALKEFAFMKALEDHGFPVPKAVDCNRHCVIMSLVQGYSLEQVRELQNPEVVFETVLGLIVRLAEHGLIHCDFNEFNIMIDDDEKVTMIDFPQMVSVSHRNAQMFFDRDVECIYKFFAKRYNLSFEDDADDNNSAHSDIDEAGRPSFSLISKSSGFLDKELAASGFTRKDQDDMEKFIERGADDEEDEDEEHVSEVHEPEITNLDSLQIEEQVEQTNEEEEKIVANQLTEKAQSDSLGVQDNNDEIWEEEDDENAAESDAELTKRLNKHKKRAIAVARGSQNRISSRNLYKDKAGRSSQSSKV